jgi:hypothetical protein
MGAGVQRSIHFARLLGAMPFSRAKRVRGTPYRRRDATIARFSDPGCLM